MNRILLSLSILLLIGLAACDRPAPDAAPEVADDSPGEERVILVTGATGTQGGAVARELLQRGYTVRGLTRDPASEDAQALAALGAEMVEGDYDDPASLKAAMEGVHGVFGVTLFWQYGYDAEVAQGKRLIDLAGEAGVDHFVLTSVAGADDASGIPHFESKWELEQYLHESGLDWTIIRPVEFMDNWRGSLEEFREGKLIDPRAPESRHQWIAASDIGFFAAQAFDSPGEWIGVTREIAGDELTLAQLQQVLEGAFDRPFQHIQPSWEEFEAQAGEESVLMVRWFEERGYDVNVAELRERYPDLVYAAEYLASLAASVEQ